jgi:hypothetical protein
LANYDDVNVKCENNNPAAMASIRNDGIEKT